MKMLGRHKHGRRDQTAAESLSHPDDREDIRDVSESQLLFSSQWQLGRIILVQETHLDDLLLVSEPERKDKMLLLLIQQSLPVTNEVQVLPASTFKSSCHRKNTSLQSRRGRPQHRRATLLWYP
jgi:hypothetical protein